MCIRDSRPAEVEELFDTGGPVVRLLRDLGAEADAMDRVWDLGFVPLAEATFQWRSQKQRPHLGSVWTLPAAGRALWRLLGRPGAPAAGGGLGRGGAAGFCA